MYIIILVLGFLITLFAGLAAIGGEPISCLIFASLGLFIIYKGVQFRKKPLKSVKKEKEEIEKNIDELNKILADKNSLMQKLKEEVIQENKEEAEKIINNAKTEAEDLQNNIDAKIADKKQQLDDLNNQIEKLGSVDKKLATQTSKLSKIKELYKSITYTIENYYSKDIPTEYINIDEKELLEIEEFAPSIMLKLHCMNVKDLKKAFKDNDKDINKILNQYSTRYTTKANQCIYKLMVIALRAELQNVLYNLRYEKLDKSIEDIKTITQKYLQIAGDGNQNIMPTLTKFIGEIEYFFINAVKIEYNYYVKKEQAKQEQLAIKQQMREEAEERKLLQEQKQKIEKEEEKFTAEINKLNDQLQTANVDETEKLKARILELQGQLSDVIIKKDEITKLQNGKAGNVYVISNLGSFGENVFKIGMTRRINPQERIDELGSASVPFRFDVHSFIFSDNAVDLEKNIHNILNEKRVNKVNLRKEFFNTSVDELEEIVTSIDPTAEFSKTMIAEEFRQSQSSNGLYSNDFSLDDDYDDEESDEDLD